MPIKNVYIEFHDGLHATPKPSDQGAIYLGIKNITEEGRLDLSEIRYISDDDFPLWTKRVTPQSDDIVFSYEATLHRYAIIPEGFWGCLGRRLALIRVDRDIIDPSFLYYYFLGAEWKQTVSERIVPGATVDRISLLEFPNFRISLPPMEVQQKIIGLLKDYDQLIENNSSRIQTLEKIVLSVYREWFINNRFPGHEDTIVIASNFGTYPENWHRINLADVVSIVRGRSYRTVDLVETGGLPFINLKCVSRDGGFRIDGLKRYKGNFKQAQTIRAGEIILAVTDITQERLVVGRAARVPDIEEGFAIFSMDLVKISPIDNSMTEYIYGLLRYSSFSNLMKQYANGANVLHLNPQRIAEYQFSIPPMNLIHRYSSVVRDIYSEQDRLEKENRLLRTARNLMLSNLVGGDFDVSELSFQR